MLTEGKTKNLQVYWSVNLMTMVPYQWPGNAVLVWKSMEILRVCKN